AGGVLHDAQDVEPVQQQGVDAEEVGGKNTLGLYAQELPPARPVAARGLRRLASGSTTRCLVQAVNGARRVRPGSAGNPRSNSPTPGAARAGAARMSWNGPRCGGVGAGPSVASPGPGATARPWQGDDPMKTASLGQQPGPRSEYRPIRPR